MKRKRFNGTVKNNVIVLENGAYLPEGAIVEVRIKHDPEQEAKLLEERRAAIQRILDHQIPGPIGLAEIIEEDKRERDEQFDYLFGGPEDAEPEEPRNH
jgi:hypothetical protein